MSKKQQKVVEQVSLTAEEMTKLQTEFAQRAWSKLAEALQGTQQEMVKEGKYVAGTFAPLTMQMMIGSWMNNVLEGQAKVDFFDMIVTQLANFVGIQTFKDEPPSDEQGSPIVH